MQINSTPFLLALAAVMGSSTAFAQTEEPILGNGFDAHGFNLAAYDADVRDPLVVQRPGAFTQGDWFLSGLGEFTKAPLVVVTAPSPGEEGTEVAAIDNLVVLNVAAGIAAHERVRFDVSYPFHVVSTDSTQQTVGPAAGDLRLSTMLVALRPPHIQGASGVGLAAVGWLDAPTGDTERFLGTGGIAGGAKLAFTAEVDDFTLSADVGSQFNPVNPEQGNLLGADTLLAGLGLGIRASETVGFTIEGVMEPPINVSDTDLQAVTSFPAEALASMKFVSDTGGFWTLGGAAGLSDGPGVAAFRLFVGGGFGQVEPPRPPDFDPIGPLATSDLCPTEPETKNGWKDDDGCPDTLGTLAIEVVLNGEPIESRVTIEGPDGTTTEALGAQGKSLDAVPGSTWTASAIKGCLRGEASAVANEEGSTLRVEMQPLFDAHVLVEVVDTDGQPIQGAKVIWQSDEPACVPAGALQATDSGLLEQDISAGKHKVTVTALGYNSFDADVELAPNDDKVVRAELGAALIIMEKKQIKILEKVQFETAKAVIKPESFALLNEVAATIVTNPDVGRVEVSGHTDARGSESYNQRLSESRANSVKDYLIKEGVAAERLLSVGYGESKPIDTNKTESGREANRRVEFNLIDATDDEEAP